MQNTTESQETKLQDLITNEKRHRALSREIKFIDVIESLHKGNGLKAIPVKLQDNLVLLSSSHSSINGKCAAILIDTSIKASNSNEENDSEEEYKVHLHPFCEDWGVIEHLFDWYMGNGHTIYWQSPRDRSDERFRWVIETCRDNDIHFLYMSHSASRFRHIAKSTPHHNVEFYNVRSWKHAAHFVLRADLL